MAVSPTHFHNPMYGSRRKILLSILKDTVPEARAGRPFPCGELHEERGKLYDSHGRRVWVAGTLTYHRRDLARLAFWLMLGQFTFMLEYIALPVMLPLILSSKGFGAVEIGTLLAMFPLGSLVLFPILGTWSDRLRTRWGRRRPIIFCAAPIWFLGLLWLPFANTYAQALGAMCVIGLAGAAGNVLIGLYNDVIPAGLMGRFTAVMQFFAGLAALVFQLVAIRFFDAHPVAIFLVIAAIGTAGQVLMLLNTREGTYAPPPTCRSAWNLVAIFLREGFANRYIIWFSLTLGVTALGGPVMGNYFNLFLKEDLALSSTQIGQLLGTGTVIGLLLLLPSGWIIDAVGPKLIWGVGGALVGILQIALFFFANTLDSIWGFFVVFAGINTMLTAALLPMMYAFIPQEKFSQLNGASQIVTRTLQVLGSMGCGAIISLGGEDYRYAFLFGGFAFLLVPVFLLLLLREPYPYDGFPPSIHPDGRRGHARSAGICKIDPLLDKSAAR